MRKKYGKGFGWGLISLIVSVVSYNMFLIIMLVSDSEIHPVLQIVIYVLLMLSYPAGFVLSFIGKKKSEKSTVARQLCYVSVCISTVLCTVVIFTISATILQNAFNIEETASYVTALIDAILIMGYFVLAYIREKLIWFL